MAHYTETTVFGPYSVNDSGKTALLVVDIGAGSASLNCKCGEEWIEQEAFTADVVKRVAIAGGTWQVVVADGAKFEWAAEKAT